eukprot:sb/3468866/
MKAIEQQQQQQQTGFIYRLNRQVLSSRSKIYFINSQHSKSLCDSMASTNPTATIARLLHSSGGCRADITIQWIPSHVDVPGNELADAAAKDATSLVTEDQGEKPVSFAAVKAHIRRVIKDEPVQHQRTAETYKNYNKDKDKDIKTRKDQVLIARLRSGHYNGPATLDAGLLPNLWRENAVIRDHSDNNRSTFVRPGELSGAGEEDPGPSSALISLELQQQQQQTGFIYRLNRQVLSSRSKSNCHS